jgi:hypothetical protein
MANLTAYHACAGTHVVVSLGGFSLHNTHATRRDGGRDKLSRNHRDRKFPGCSDRTHTDKLAYGQIWTTFILTWDNIAIQPNGLFSKPAGEASAMLDLALSFVKRPTLLRRHNDGLVLSA